MQREEKSSRSKPKQQIKIPAELAQARKRAECLHRFMQETANPLTRQEAMEALKEVNKESALFGVGDKELMEHYGEKMERVEGKVEEKEGQGRKGKRGEE